MFRRQGLHALVLLFVLGDVAPAAFPNQCIYSTHATIRKLRELVGRDPYRWESTIRVDDRPLAPGPLSYPRGVAILRAATAPDSRLVAQFLLETGLVIDQQSPAFWDLYMRSYDLLAFSHGYLDLVFKVSGALLDLPTSSHRVLDLGCGTGNVAALLADDLNLEVTLVDTSTRALEIARRKMQHLNVAERRYRLVTGNVVDASSYAGGPYGAAILNNVLYTLPLDDKRRVLRNVAASLERNGRLIVGDPRPSGIQPGAGLVEFYRLGLQTALENGAPVEDFNLLAMIAVNLTLHASPMPRHLSTGEELVTLAEAEGLELIDADIAYFDTANVLVFRRR